MPVSCPSRSRMRWARVAARPWPRLTATACALAPNAARATPEETGNGLAREWSTRPMDSRVCTTFAAGQSASESSIPLFVRILMRNAVMNEVDVLEGGNDLFVMGDDDDCSLELARH